MENIIAVWVRNRIARADNTVYVCGNSDFFVHFDFDDTWAAHKTKTARFVCDDDTYKDVVFDGDTCPVPVLSNTYKVRVGVFAGDLYTTTPALIGAKKSILCISGAPAAPSDDVYNQIMTKLNGISSDIGAVVREYLEENPVAGGADIAITETADGVEIAITDEEGTKSYSIHHGKDGYTPVKGIDYVDGKDGYTPVKGVDYSDGEPGEDGFSPVVAVSSISGGKRVSITDKNGTKTFDLLNGTPGDPGDPGYTPVKGKDYWTTADKAEMVTAVLAALPVYTGEVETV